MTSGTKPSKSSQSFRKTKSKRGSKTTLGRMRSVALAKMKDDLSRYLNLASDTGILITRHGRPAGVLIGFRDEEAWVDYQIENHPEFLERIAKAREALRAGSGTRLEDLGA